jgi:hypothetical protein
VGDYPLSSLSAQEVLADCSIGLATLDLAASAPLCQSLAVRFRTGYTPPGRLAPASGLSGVLALAGRAGCWCPALPRRWAGLSGVSWPCLSAPVEPHPAALGCQVSIGGISRPRSTRWGSYRCSRSRARTSRCGHASSAWPVSRCICPARASCATSLSGYR